MNISNSFGVNSIFNTLYQGNMALHSNRLSRSSFPFPENNAQNSGASGASTVQFVNNLRTDSGALSQALKELSGSTFSNRTIESSNSNTMTASISSSGSRNFSPMTVKVDQVATGQINEGARTTANAEFEGNTGTNRISIQTESKLTQISVNVQQGDTNRDVQQKMADAINKSNAGVRATVEFNSETNSSMLRLESTTTGNSSASAFTVRDVSGDLTERMGANDIASEGQNAMFSVNGGATRTSQSNTVFIGSGVTATFNKASEEAVTLTQGRSANASMGAVEDLVKSYNNLFTAASERTSDPRSQNLASRMVNISGTFSGSLQSIGIGFDSSGRMTLDKERLGQAAESGRLDELFSQGTGRNFGFANQMGRLADDVSRNTSSFVSSALFGTASSGNFMYGNFGNPISFNFFHPGSILDFML